MTEMDHERIRKHVAVTLPRRRDSEVSQVVKLHPRSSLKTVLLRNATSGPRNTTPLPTWRNTSYGSCTRSAVVVVVAAAVVVETKTGDSPRK